jgi:hypothetical protein
MKDRPYILGLVAVAFILVIYLPALDIYLMGDDFEWLNESYGIRQNPAVMFREINHFFRPLIKLTYLLNYTLFNTQTPLYNLTNILIHLLAVFLLYIFILKISGKLSIAFLASLAFGLSPLHSECTLWAAGRVDSVLLVFMLAVLILYNHENKKYRLIRFIGIILFSLCALGSKETWMLLPFLVLVFLLISKRNSLKTALLKAAPLFLLLILYIGYFIVLPLLSGQGHAPTAYADATLPGALKKFAFLVFEYFGLEGIFTGAAWQYAAAVLFPAGLLILFIRTKNRLALWGLSWLLITISISLPIDFAPSRYNYIPLAGFWMMVMAFLSWLVERLKQGFRIHNLVLLPGAALVAILFLALQVIAVQKEIKDYHYLGASHKTIADMYLQIKDRLPHDRPIIFADISKRKVIHEAVGNLQGRGKVLLVREKAIREIVFLPTLANFTGEPFKEIMETIPDNELQSVFAGDFTVLVFNDDGFFISETSIPRFREYFQPRGELPYKTTALRFVRVKKESPG